MKQWIGVEVYGLIVQDVHVFTDLDKAKEWFKEFTHVDYELHSQVNLGPFDQTKIFDEDVPAEKPAQFDLTKPGKYYFEIGIHGEGKNAEDAWDTALEGIVDELGAMDPDEIVDFETLEEG